MKYLKSFSVELVREKSLPVEFDGYRINSPQSVYDLFKPILSNQPKEQFWVMLLNVKNAIIGVAMISQGTVNASIVHPREVFQPAILSNATGIIAVHNHPSGDSEPSPEDIQVTKRLAEAGEIVGIPLLDHVIVGDGLTSLKARGFF